MRVFDRSLSSGGVRFRLLIQRARTHRRRYRRAQSDSLAPVAFRSPVPLCTGRRSSFCFPAWTARSDMFDATREQRWHGRSGVPGSEWSGIAMRIASALLRTGRRGVTSADCAIRRITDAGRDRATDTPEAWRPAGCGLVYTKLRIVRGWFCRRVRRSRDRRHRSCRPLRRRRAACVGVGHLVWSRPRPIHALARHERLRRRSRARIPARNPRSCRRHGA